MMHARLLAMMITFITTICNSSNPSMRNSFSLDDGPGVHVEVRFVNGQVNLYGNIRYHLVHDVTDKRIPANGAVQEGGMKSPGVVPEAMRGRSLADGVVHEGTELSDSRYVDSMNQDQKQSINNSAKSSETNRDPVGSVQNSTGSLDTSGLSDNMRSLCCLNFNLKDTKTAVNGNQPNITFCHCDEKCALFGDCCPDMMNSCPEMLDNCPEILDSCLGLNNTERILNFHQQLKHDSHLDVGMFSLFEALAKYPNNLEMILDNILLVYGSCVPQAGILMVAKCPNTADDAVKTKCENSSSPFIPPVTVNITLTHTVNFRNIFCARCHGLASEAITIWPSQISCYNDYQETTSDLKNLLESKKCHVEFPQPVSVTDVRFCWNASQKYACMSVPEDKVCTPSDEIMCSFYLDQIYQFRNKHCMACNISSHLSSLDKCHQQSEDATVAHQQYGGTGAGSGSILIILDIFGTFSDPRTGLTINLCDDHEIYDTLTSECHMLFCSYGYEPYKGKCVKTEAAYFVTPRAQLFPNGWNTLKISAVNYVDWNVSNVHLNSVLNMKHLNSLNITNIYVNMNDVRTNDEASERYFQILKKDRSKDGAVGIESIVVNVKLRDNITRATLTEAEIIAQELNNIVNGNGSCKYIITNMMGHQLCPGGKPAEGLKDFTIREYKGRVYAMVNSSHTKGVFYPLDNTGYQVELGVTSGERKAAIYVCDVIATFAGNCSVVKLDVNQTQVVNGSRQILINGHVFNEDEYLIVDGEVFVCAVSPDDPSNLPQSILSYALTAVSCVLLLVMLAVYSRHQELRTLPGKMTASLAATMMSTFLFNLFSMENIRHPLFCPIAAALSHVVTLAQFGWMSAIAVDMALTFGSFHGVRIISPKNIFSRYNLAVWGTSVCLVLTAVVLDIIEPDPPQANNVQGSNTTSEPLSKLEITNFPRYGYPHCSWFSGAMWTRLAFVIVPFALTYLNNIVCFTIALTGIHKASQHSAKVGKKRSDLTRCLIFFKLSTAMGFTWILSLVVSLDPQNQVMVCSFICCILLQGALLFVAFMCNQRVYGLVFGKRHNSNSAQKSTNVSVTKLSPMLSKR